MDREVGRVALVTGAGRGIGRAVAERLSDQGLRVALTARSRGELEATAGSCAGETLVLPADITEPGTVDGIFAAVEAAWGPVEVLVANAGASTSGPIQRVSDEDWHRMLDLNVTAPFRCIRRAVPAMKAAGYGRIVAVASTAAKHGEPYLVAYTASKHAVLGLIRSVATELARSGVTANAVCPAFVDTPMTDGTVANIVATTGRPAGEARHLLEGRQPIGRLITADEVAEAVCLCIANGAINGQGINLDGGAVQS